MKGMNGMKEHFSYFVWRCVGTRKHFMQVNSSACRGRTRTESSSPERSAPGSSKPSAASVSSSSTTPEFLSERRAWSSWSESSLRSSSVLRGAS